MIQNNPLFMITVLTREDERTEGVFVNITFY
jgi:hypothetical protein